jgi:hypothetical protein
VEDVIVMEEDNSLLLFVDVNDFKDMKVKLDKTYKSDSLQHKRKQVVNNLIENSRVLYNRIMNSNINEVIENRFENIQDVECNEHNENENVVMKVIVNRKSINNYKKYIVSKCEDVLDINTELSNTLNEVSNDYFEKQQQTTTKTVKYNNKTPRTFVLKRLESIGMMLASSDSVIFTNNELKQIINDVLDNPDERTVKSYYECLTNFAKENGGIQGGLYKVKFNMRGFLDSVKSIRGSKLC